MLFTASVVINNRVLDELFATLKILNDSNKIIKIICIFNGNVEPKSLHDLNLDKIETYRVENKGYGAAHNYAINKILEFKTNHLILNPDIKIEKNQLERFLLWFNSLEKVGIGAPRISNISKTNSISAYLNISFCDAVLRRISYSLYMKTKNGRSAQSIANSKKIISVDLVSGCFMALSHLILNEKLFDERYFLYYEDYDLCKYVKKIKKLNILFNPNIYVIHIEGRESAKKISLFFIHFVSHLKYYIKWFKK